MTVPPPAGDKEPAAAADREASLSRSWRYNAENWTHAVRRGLIASRKAGTDAAILDAVERDRPKRLLDAGCGEGWLTREIRQRIGCECVGIDASAELVAFARAADPGGTYIHSDYGRMVDEPAMAGTGFDAVIFNFALLGENIAGALHSAGTLLNPSGRIYIQTLHPWPTIPDTGYRSGWQIEDFSGFDDADCGSPWAPMPWFYRTVEDWSASLADAGMALTALHEPMAGEGCGARPLSLLLICGLV